MLEHSYAFDFRKEKKNEYKNRNISEDKFSQWSRDNMYRTSYGNHWTNKPQMPKNMDIPGYGGFVPTVKSKNEYGKTFSRVSREMYDDPNLGKNKSGLASTGYNISNYKHIDYSLYNNNNRYGNQTLQTFHPNLQEHNAFSNTKGQYTDPKSKVCPTYRKTDNYLQTHKEHTVMSGFNSNYQKCDGKGWVPHPVLDTPRDRSEYRDVYNQKMQFHRSSHVSVDRTLKTNCNTYFR